MTTSPTGPEAFVARALVERIRSRGGDVGYGPDGREVEAFLPDDLTDEELGRTAEALRRVWPHVVNLAETEAAERAEEIGRRVQEHRDRTAKSRTPGSLAARGETGIEAVRRQMRDDWEAVDRWHREAFLPALRERIEKARRAKEAREARTAEGAEA